MPGSITPLTPFSDQERDAAVTQYTAFVHWTERLIDRRAEANRFYSGINTAVLVGVGYLLFGNDFNSDGHEVLLLAFPLIGICLSVIWFCVLRSHRNILKCKFGAIHEMEVRLPLDPYRKENALWTGGGGSGGGAGYSFDVGGDGSGRTAKDGKSTKRGSAIFERCIPLLFGLLHVVLFGYLVVFVVLFKCFPDHYQALPDWIRCLKHG